jgi:hypothetical protein
VLIDCVHCCLIVFEVSHHDVSPENSDFSVSFLILI